MRLVALGSAQSRAARASAHPAPLRAFAKTCPCASSVARNSRGVLEKPPGTVLLMFSCDGGGAPSFPARESY
eukprot:14914683-Alexandrium_andersonii.AAC.1